MADKKWSRRLWGKLEKKKKKKTGCDILKSY